MQITSAFDGGNIKVLKCLNPLNMQLEIEPDANADYYQWFYFRLVGAKNMPCRMNILNAKGAYVGGWDGYKAVVSTDRKDWKRVDTEYKNGVLTISYTPESDSVYVAYFAPYTMERHADLIANALNTNLAALEVIGKTLDGQNIDLLTVGTPSKNKLLFWITARQHPAETMAEWWMEGFLERLLNKNDPVACQLRHDVAFYIVPNMNPDGSYRGHLRTNAIGTDLNRSWKDPSKEFSPEVYYVRKHMYETKPDLALDVHGTEDTPHAFIIGPEGPAGYAQPVAGLVEQYKAALLQASPDFQTKVGFDIPLDEAVDALATNFLGETFGSLCMTLEMPFKDTTHTPDKTWGWSPERCKQMGRDNLTAMAKMVAPIRQARKSWT